MPRPPMKNEKINVPAALKLCQELPLIQERLHRIGLHKTAHKMDAAVQEIGYELADEIEKITHPKKDS